MAKNRWRIASGIPVAITVGVLLTANYSHAWWSAPVLGSSTHHLLTDGAEVKISNLAENYPDLAGKIGGDISDWTSGATDDTRAHANASDRNDGPISRWWEYALAQYKLFRFSGSGDPLSSEKPGAYYYIALMAHLTEDMGVPAHAYNIPHGWVGAMDNMEQIADSNWSNADPTISLLDPGISVSKNYDLLNNFTKADTSDSSWRAYYNNDGGCGYWYGEPDNPLKKGFYSGACGAEDSFHWTWLMSSPAQRATISELLGAAGGYAGGTLMAISRSLPPLVKDFEIYPANNTSPLIDIRNGTDISFKVMENRLPDVQVTISVRNLSTSVESTVNANGVIWNCVPVNIPGNGKDLPYEWSTWLNQWRGEVESGRTLPSGTYSMKIEVLDHDGNPVPADVSTVHEFTIDSTQPAKPTGLNVRAGDGRARLTWTAPTKNFDGSDLTDLAGYWINYAIGSTSPSRLWVPAPATSYELTPLTNDKIYFVWLTAQDGVGNESEPSATVSVRPLNALWVHQLGGPSGSYTTIGPALAAAYSGSIKTVMVGPGDYTEPQLTIGPDLSWDYPTYITLMSERGPAQTTIYGESASEFVVRVGDYSRLIGFTISHPGAGRGIQSWFNNGVLIANNIFVANSLGIYFSGTEYSSVGERALGVYNNVFHGNQTGIYGYWNFGEDRIRVFNNIFEGNSSAGIEFSNTAGFNVQYNDFSGNGKSIWNSGYWSDSDNYVSGNSYWSPGFVNISSDPHDYHLRPGSPARDAGSSFSYIDPVTQKRSRWLECDPTKPDVDMGAFGGPFAYIDNNGNSFPDCDELRGVPVTVAMMRDTIDYPILLEARTPRSDDAAATTPLAALSDAGTLSDLTFTVVSGPDHGTLSGTPPDVAYTPAPGYTGEDAFSFTVSGEMGVSEPARVTITVKAANAPPVAVDQTIRMASNSSVTLALQGSDADGDALTYAVDSSPLSGNLQCLMPPNCGFLPEYGFTGEVSFTYHVNDGMADSAPGTVRFLVGSAPGIAVTAPAAAQPATNASSFTIAWSETIPNGSGTISLYRDGDPFGFDGELIVADIPASDPADAYTWDIAGLSDGTYYVYAAIRDAGVTALAYAPGPLVIDRTGPIVTPEPPGGLYRTAQSVTLSANEPATIFYTTDGSEPTTASAVYGAPIAVDANTTIRFFAVDTLGNTGAVTDVSYAIDTVPPTIGIDPFPAIWRSTVMTVIGTMEAAATVSLTVDTAATTGPVTYPTATTWSSDVTGLVEGTNTFTAMATDAAGNPAQATAGLLVNLNRPPTAPVVRAPRDQGQVTTVQPQLEIMNGVDPDGDLVTYAFQVFSNAAMTQLVTSTSGVPAGSGGTTSWVVNPELADGARYYWKAVATDEHGTTAASAAASFVVAVATNWTPTVLSVHPQNGATAPATTDVSATFSEPMDPATITTGSFTLSQYVGFGAVSAGDYHTVALKNDGTVAAWGMHNAGQTEVPAGLVGVTAVAGGGSHTIALLGDGTVNAWGDNTYSQCDVPAGLSGVTAIAAGINHSVALKDDGNVVAWGRNEHGQTTVPAGLSGVTAIAAGDYHTVALKGDGTVVAWGWDNFGQLTPPPGLSGVTAIAAGVYNTVALKDDGTVVGWGDNAYGQITPPPGLSGVAAIATGGYHTLALKNDGTVIAFGNTMYNMISVPPGLSGVTAIAAGVRHSVALKSDGTAVTWGWDGYGQCTIPAGLSGVAAIAAGDYHAAGLRNDGTVVAWGMHNYGQSTVPTGLSGVTAVAAGAYHTVALKSDGSVTAWGRNTWGQTSVPGGLSEVTAIAAAGSASVALKNDGTVVAWGYSQGSVPAGLSGVTAIATGGAHTLALRNDGTVVAWGNNASNQCAVPADLSWVTAVAAGSAHSVALQYDGSVVVWGDNTHNQMTVPEGFSGVTAIAAGYTHTVALKNDGTVLAWGDDTYGQSTVPAGLSGVAAIAAGYSYSVAVKNDGTAVAWGVYPAFYSPLGPYETAVPGTVAYDEGTWTATFTPSAPLEYGATYYATVNTGVRSELGVPLAADLLWSFTVTDPLAIQTTSLPDATEGGPYSQTLVASGGSAPYAWSMASGSLPAGLSLSPGGVISGTPTAAGAASFTARAVDAFNSTDTQDLTLVVYPRLEITTSSLPDGYVGTAYSQTLSASGGRAPLSWSLSGGSLPAGLSLSAGGVIGGTPTGAGSTFTVQVADANSAKATKTLTIDVYASLAVTTSSLPDGYVETPYNQTLTATGGKPSYSWSVIAGSLPAGLSLSAGGVIGGTPTGAGSTFTVQVADANAAKATKTLTIDVYANLAVSTSNLADGNVGTGYNESLSASGGKIPYIWSVIAGSLPAGLSLSAGGVISGTPTAAGSTFTVQVADANVVKATKTLNIAIVSTPVVAPLNAWTNLYSASPNNTSASNLNVGSFAVGTGTNRLLLVAVVMEIGTAANPTISATYGGTAVPQIRITANTQREIVWLGYLTDAQIGSGSKALKISYSGATGKVSALHVKWTSYTGVNQSSPVGSSGATNAAATSATFGSAISYVNNGLTVVVAGNGGTPATGTLTATPAFTAGTATTTNAQTSRAFTTATHTAAGSYAASTAVSWSGTTSAWSGLVVASLKPATVNRPPAFGTNPISKPNATVGVAYTGQTLAGLATDAEGDAITFSKVSGPAWLSVAASGALSGTPTTVTSDSFVVRATATGGLADATLNITVVAAPAVVAQLDTWVNLYSGNPNSTSASNLNVGSFAVGSGSNRLLLVSVVMEIGRAANPTVSATYGGAALTQIAITANTQTEIIWMGYLKEAQIGSGSKALAITFSGATNKASGLHVKWASFSGVNQTTPALNSRAANTASTSVTFGGTINYVANGMTTVVAGNGGTPATGTLTATPSFIAATADTTNGHTSRAFTTAKHTAAGSYPGSTAVTWTGTTSPASGLVVVSLQP